MRARIVLMLCAVAATASAADRLAVGGQASYGTEVASLGVGPPSGVRLATGELHLQAALLTSGGHPRLQVISAVMAGQTLRPGSRFMTGLTATFRFHGRPGRRYGWYGEAGTGIVSSALQVPALDGWLQYYSHAGVGVRRRTGASGTLTAGFQLGHFSNNGTRPPNHGLNVAAVVVGYAVTLH